MSLSMSDYRPSGFVGLGRKVLIYNCFNSVNGGSADYDERGHDISIEIGYLLVGLPGAVRVQ